MYNCIIIDDEEDAIAGLIRYIESVQYLQLIESYTDPIKAVKIMEGPPVDIIFMDVDMPAINGIELSRIIRSKTKKLVFTTAHTKYAFEAYEVDADAYLLKPYSIGKFLSTINKLFPEQNVLSEPERSAFFFVKNKNEGSKIVKVRYDEIIAVESRLNYILIHTTSKQVLTYMSLSEISKILSPLSDFFQLHRSFIVRGNHIDLINGNTIKMTNGLELTVGEVYRKEFNAFVSGNLINAGKKR